MDLLLRVHAADGYPGHLPDDAARFVAPPYERHAWVAEHEGRLVGHVALHDAAGDPTLPAARRATGLRPDGLAVLARLFVAPDARGLGIGRALVDRALDEARAEHRRTVLDVVRGFAAADFYVALGWTRLEDLSISVAGTRLDLWVYLSPE